MINITVGTECRDERMRTPRPHYFKNGVIVYYVKDDEIYYKILKWSENGLSQWIDKTGKFNGNIEELII